MGEKVSIIDLKKESLKEELSKENPDKKVIKRLKESIKRHKNIARYIRDRRVRSKRDY